MHHFNSVGPIDPEKHYCIPPLERLEPEYVLELIDQMKIFVLYAPRQSGKTTYLLALRDELNRARRLHCIYFNAEAGHAAGEDTEAAMRAILGELIFDLALKPLFRTSLWDTDFQKSTQDKVMMDQPASVTEAAY